MKNCHNQNLRCLFALHSLELNYYYFLSSNSLISLLFNELVRKIVTFFLFRVYQETKKLGKINSVKINDSITFYNYLNNAVSVIISTLLINFLFSEHREKVEQST